MVLDVSDLVVLFCQRQHWNPNRRECAEAPLLATLLPNYNPLLERAFKCKIYFVLACPHGNSMVIIH